jgi:hypothetical protein
VTVIHDVVSELPGQARKRSVRRTALWLALLAAAFYVGFIVLSVLRGH